LLIRALAFEQFSQFLRNFLPHRCYFKQSLMLKIIRISSRSLAAVSGNRGADVIITLAHGRHILHIESSEICAVAFLAEIRLLIRR
jgi:hypothetical protein